MVCNHDLNVIFLQKLPFHSLQQPLNGQIHPNLLPYLIKILIPVLITLAILPNTFPFYGLTNSLFRRHQWGSTALTKQEGGKSCSSFFNWLPGNSASILPNQMWLLVTWQPGPPHCVFSNITHTMFGFTYV